jgi:hypothetical protein
MQTLIMEWRVRRYRTGLYSLRSPSPADLEAGMPGLDPAGDDPSRR